MLVGRVAPDDYIRGLLRFDLAGALPSGAVVVDARLELTIRDRDTLEQTRVKIDDLAAELRQRLS